MSFESDTEKWLAKVTQRRKDLFVNVASGVLESIRSGSPVTTAPGQPVDTGRLKASWTISFDRDTAFISTDVEYAPGIEDGVGSQGQPIQLRSQVGGFHSVALTRTGFRLLVLDEARKLGAPG